MRARSSDDVDHGTPATIIIDNDDDVAIPIQLGVYALIKILKD